MAVAEDRSWEYTLGRIDERTDQHGRDIGRLCADVARVQAGLNEAREAMLPKTTFFAVAAVIAALPATMTAMK